MSRVRKHNPGRILFVGAGPGDPALLTVRARDVLAGATIAFTDPDVDRGVVALVGTTAGRDAETGEPVAEVRPALGEPTEVAKTLVAEAKNGHDVVRLVAGDPLTTDSVIAEVNAVARTHVVFEVLPGLTPGSAVPSYAGMALGSCHTEVDVRGEVDWAALAAAPGPLVLHATSGHLAETASALVEHGLAPQTPAAITVRGTTRQQRTVEATLATLNDAGSELVGPLVVTVGKIVSQRGKLSWWESRALYGWTVLVPRTKEQAGEMSERLVTHGAIPIEVPTIAVEPPRSPAQMERAVKGLVDGRYQWVVFTSTNAVRAVWEKFEAFGLDARAFSGVKIACVGQATADKVRSFGITPELVPSGEQSSEGLLAEFAPYDDVFDPVNRVLLPRADIATETLAEGLRERGWEIDDVTAYRTVRAAPPPAETREMIKTGGFDAVCFTSSSTVRNRARLARKVSPPMYPDVRPRRLRTTPAMRRLVAETSLEPRHLVLPMFVADGLDAPREIPSMPGVYQHTPDSLPAAATAAVEAGVGGLMLFGVPRAEDKDARGSGGTDPDGVLNRALRDLRAELGDATVLMADTCLDEFTDHGHCGVLGASGAVDNDATLERYAEMAVAQAEAGAHLLGPSGMMDGQVASIRAALDAAGHQDVGQIAYSAKYASAFYGPFRDAVGSSLEGDRRTYQQDPANRREALREVDLDLAEGADLVMVKPAMSYLDVLREVADRSDVPVAAYQISGEYAMITAAAQNGWIDRDTAILESLTSIRRAGADIVLTYWAAEVAGRLS